jgi:hypothetical protein
MGIYDRQIKNTLKAIKKKGWIVTWNEISIINGLKKWETSSAITEHSVSILFSSTGLNSENYKQDKDKSDEREGYLLGYMGAVSFVPDQSHTVSRNNEILSIKSITPINLNGQVILYIIKFYL